MRIKVLACIPTAGARKHASIYFCIILDKAINSQSQSARKAPAKLGSAETAGAKVGPSICPSVHLFSP